MKKIFVLTMITLLSVLTAKAYDFNNEIPVKGKTLADTQLQTNMLFSVYSYGLRIAAPDCQNFSITDTKVSKNKVNGNWEEIWTLKACTRTAQIPIRFTTADDGIHYAIEPMGVKVAK